jgi:hypothetical protein
MTDPLPAPQSTGGEELSDLVEVTFIYDPALGSPTSTQALGGKVIGVPSTSIPLPLRGKLLGQPGFGRQMVVPDPQDPASTIHRWEWVLQGGTDPVDTFIDSLTGRGGWVNVQARTVVKTLVQRLFSAGISRTTIQTQVPQLYQAIAAEVRAQDALGS